MGRSLPAALSWALALLAVGCSTRPTAPVPDSRPAIIVIPGFYGSALRDPASGRRVFLTGLEALFGRSALSLFQAELGTPEGPPLEVDGLLETVPVLPGLYEVDVYSPLLRRLRDARPDAQVIPLAYDWRDDLSLAVSRLDALIGLLREKKSPSISLVAHSMGGLVAAYYLAYGTQAPEKARLRWEGARAVSRALFLGTPFRGSMITFRSFDKGSGLPRSARLLPPDAMSSFPSMYQLLPGDVTLREKDGRPRPVNLFAAGFWERNRLGLLRRVGLEPGLVSARERFTRLWLGQASRFAARIRMEEPAPLPPASLQVLNVMGAGHQTLDSGYLEEGSGRLYFDPEDVRAARLDPGPLFRDGDQTVTLSSAALPAALAPRARSLTSPYAHDKLFLDPALDREYKDFLGK